MHTLAWHAVVAAVSPTQVQEEVDHPQEKLEEAMGWGGGIRIDMKV
jgi:hypothetical protein